MNRRDFLKGISANAVVAGSAAGALTAGSLFGAEGALVVDASTAKNWLARWETNIASSAAVRYCDKELGEGLGWRISPILRGYYYGYLATHDTKWIDGFIDWTDSLIKRGVNGPDGFLGWPMLDPDGGGSQVFGDSLLGESMVMTQLAYMSDEIVKTPALEKKYGTKARGYLQLAGQTFEKWDSRSCWHETKQGGIWVFPPFGVDRQTGQWTAGYAERKTGGMSHPDNKENEMAGWMLAMHDVTRKPIYRERAEGWFRVMKSRIQFRENGKYLVWNYWEPAGPWDYKADGTTKHWVGVHPNGGYYHMDAAAIVSAFEHGLVFKREDIDLLIATNRDFMWNKEVNGARFQRIDGGPPDPRWKDSPGLLWDALIPYDETLRKIFLANHRPVGWGALSTTPWAVTLHVKA